MIPKNRFSITMQIGGAVIFCITIFVIIAFSLGYEYDPASHGFTKKSVVHFEGGLGEGSQVFLNGIKVSVTESGELRALPGSYDLAIRKDRYHPFQKHIKILSDEVLNFKQIRLLPISLPESFLIPLESSASWVMESFSWKGFFLVNSKLHVGKFYSFNKPGKKFWIRDLPFDFFHLLVNPDPSSFWVGLASDRQIFSYDSEKGTVRMWEDKQRFLELKDATESVLGLDTQGRIWEVARDSRSPRLLFSLATPVAHIQRVMSEPSNYAFLLSLANSKSTLVITDKDGKILFQDDSASSMWLGGDKVHYTRQSEGSASELRIYSLKEKKLITQKPINESIIWLSPVGNTFHFLFLAANRDLKYCDQDFENCHTLAKLDTDTIESSLNNTIFVAAVNGRFTLFDFEETFSFPEFLHQLVSGIFSASAPGRLQFY